MDAVDPTLPGPALIPFEPQVILWSDGLDKERWFAIPDGSFIHVNPDGDFDFPNGTVLVKHFRFAGKLIETRLFVRHDDGGWAGYSYEWDDLETDATLLPGSHTRDLAGQVWSFPSRNQCLQCHTSAAGFSLGPETLQLNHDFSYPSPGSTANQLAALESVGFFDAPLAPPGSTLPAIDDLGATLEDRGRAYLHANCASCHRPGNPIQPSVDFLFPTSTLAMNACNVLPQFGDLGVGATARIIAPGSPADSIASLRMHDLAGERMPPLGSAVVDPAGTTVVDDWISGWNPSAQDCPAAPDQDTDLVPDAWDNCVAIANGLQTDTDADGDGDACDEDDDNDGLLDIYETDTGIYLSPTNTGSDPLLVDTDGDGFDDASEVSWGSDPTDSSSNAATLPGLTWVGIAALVCTLTALASRIVRRRSA